MPGVSQRGIRLPASPIRKLTPFADAAKSRGMKVYHLNIGQPDLPTPKKALDALKHIDRTTLEYSPSNGFKSLREKLVGYYDRFGIKVTENEIIISSGGSEALLLTFLSCLDPGDEIILTEPSYANYQSFAVNAGVTVKTVTSDISNGFALPPVEYFEKAITDKTKAILICNPNNPTGYLYSEEELYHLRDIVRDHDLFLFSDEVYREFRYTDEPYLSALSLPGIEQNVVVIDSVSKRYSECGIRVGMIVSHNAEVMKTLLKMCQTRLSPPLLGQIVAEASIEGTEEYSKECFNEYLEKYAGHIGYSVRPSERRKGYATAMLRDALPYCRELGITDVLISCVVGNEGSRKTILNNGGVYESTVHEPELDRDLERYWIHLG